MQTTIQSIKSYQLEMHPSSSLFSPHLLEIGCQGRQRLKRHGHDRYLTEVEEWELIAWCFKMQEMAFSVTLPILKNIV